MAPSGNDESRAVQVAKAFFQACTKLSEDNEDILPQEDGVDQKLSVFCLFSELFPEFANDKDRPDNSGGKHGLMRLQFNKIGYEMYDKEQSRRVPAVRAKPGNPGYGFRRARWRDLYSHVEDRRICETIMRTLGVSNERLERIKKRVNDFKVDWDAVRRPSRPAGPGRPRGHKRGPSDPVVNEVVAAVPVNVPAQQQMKIAKKQKKGTGQNGKSELLQEEVFGEETTPMAALIVDGAPWGMHSEASSSDGGRGSNSGEAGEVAVGACGDVATESQRAKLLHGENSSLRALNMSLIYEREQLLVQIQHDDKEVGQLQLQLEKLIDLIATRQANGSEVAPALRALVCKVVAKTPSDEKAEIPAHYRTVLEQSLESYEQHCIKMSHQQRMRDKKRTCEGQQDAFTDLISTEPIHSITSSCQDIRVLLRPTGTADREANHGVVGEESCRSARTHAWAAGVNGRNSHDAHVHVEAGENLDDGNVGQHVAQEGFLDLDESCADMNYAHLFDSHISSHVLAQAPAF